LRLDPFFVCFCGNFRRDVARNVSKKIIAHTRQERLEDATSGATVTRDNVPGIGTPTPTFCLEGNTKSCSVPVISCYCLDYYIISF
jgi:hypothetical protein